MSSELTVVCSIFGANEDGSGLGVMLQQLFRFYANAVCSGSPVGKGLHISRIGARHPVKDLPSSAFLF